MVAIVGNLEINVVCGTKYSGWRVEDADDCILQQPKLATRWDRSQSRLHHQGQGCRVSMLNVGIKPDYDNNIRIVYIMLYQYLAYIIFYIIFSTVVWLYQIKHLHIIYVILQGKRIYSSWYREYGIFCM